MFWNIIWFSQFCGTNSLNYDEQTFKNIFQRKKMHFIEYLPLLWSNIVVQSHEVKLTHKVSCASSWGRAQLYVGIPYQKKLRKRKMESDCNFLTLHCSEKPGRSEGELVWRKWMITIIHYHWRMKEQQKNEEDFWHEGILNSYAVCKVSVAWSCMACLLRLSKFPKTK